MPGYVLGEQAIRQIRELFRAEAARLQNPDTQRGRWQGPQFPCDVLGFRIDSADCSEGTAVATITYRPCGCGELKGETETDGVPKIDLVDVSCFFQQSTDENLIDREGFAHLLYADEEEQKNEKQTLDIEHGTPTSGTFTITVTIDGVSETTTTINWDGTAEEVQAALEALDIIGAGNVQCTGGPLPGTPIVIEFIGDLEKTDIDLMTTGDSTLNHGAVPVITETQKGVTDECVWAITWLCPINETCA